MHLHKFNVLVAALVMTTGLAASIDDADARQRTRTRSVSNIDGARQIRTSAAGSGVRGSYARSRNLSTDGQGNGGIFADLRRARSLKQVGRTVFGRPGYRPGP